MHTLHDDAFFTDQPLEKRADRLARILAQHSAPDDAQKSRRFCFGYEHIVKYQTPTPLRWDE